MRDIKRIGSFLPDTPFFLAPMAGFTDSAYRTLCGEMGAALTYTEMVSAKGLYYKDRKSPELLHIGEGEKPVAFQIFGSDPDIMAWAAEKLDKEKNVILDINMGCPVPKVVKNGEGSALLRNPDLVYRIVKKVSEATKKPVTIKMRIGIGGAPKDAHILCAKAAEEGGAAAVAVHGRTREQYYSGTSNSEAIKEVKDYLSIPVIGNGDVKDFDDGSRLMEYTGCDFVMIGRRALGNPWIFREVSERWKGKSKDEIEIPNLEDIKEMILAHYKALEELKTEYVAVREMRKFIPRYLKGVPGSAKIRGEINMVERGDDLQRLIKTI